MGAVVLCSGSHVWGSFCRGPFKVLACQVPWWAPRRLLLERSLACVSPGLHQGGILAAETTLLEVKTATCASEGPSGLTLLPPTSSRYILSVLVGGGRGVCPWEPGLVPLQSLAPGSRLCSPVLLGGGAVWKLQGQPLPRACPAILEGSGLLSHVPGGILAPLASSRRPSCPLAGPGHLPGQQTAPGLGEESSVRLGAMSRDPGKPRDGWCSGLPTCLPVAPTPRDPPTPVTESPAGVKVPVLAHLRGCRGAERLTRAAHGRASNGTHLCKPQARGRPTLGCLLRACFSL